MTSSSFTNVLTAEFGLSIFPWTHTLYKSSGTIVISSVRSTWLMAGALVLIVPVAVKELLTVVTLPAASAMLARRLNLKN